MSRKTQKTEFGNLDDLLCAIQTAVDVLIPDSISDCKIHYEVLATHKQDRDWSVAIPKTNKVKNYKDCIKNVIKTFKPSAISVIIYSTENREYAQLLFKVDDCYIPLVDGEEEKDKKQAQVTIDRTDTYQGLGVLGELSLKNEQINHQNQMDRLRDKYDSEFRFLKFTTDTKIDTLTRENEELKARNKKLEEDYENLSADYDEMSEELEGAKSSMQNSNLKGIVALASDFLESKGLKMDGLRGWATQPNNEASMLSEEEQYPQLAQAPIQEVDETQQNEDISILSAWICALSEKTRDDVLMILRAIQFDKSLSERICDFIKQPKQSIKPKTIYQQPQETDEIINNNVEQEENEDYYAEV